MPSVAAWSASPPSKLSYSRTVTKTFQVASGAAFSVTNKYGKVDVVAWDKNEIRAVVTITTDAASDEDARDLAGQIVIHASQSGPQSVSLSTAYDPSEGGGFWSRFFGISAGSQRKSVHIDYALTVPRSLASVAIHNSYGDVSANGLTGQVSVHLNYGHFRLTRIQGNLTLDVNYGKGSLSDIQGGSVGGNYSDFQLDNVSNLQYHSNYSDCKVTNATGLEFRANYGNFTADQITDLQAHSNYTDYKIGSLGGASELDVTYGNVRIRSLAKDFGGLDYKGTYGDLSVGIISDRPLRLDIRLTRGNLKTSSLDLGQVTRNSSGGNMTLSGTLAGGGEKAPRLQIKGTYTDVTLQAP